MPSIKIYDTSKKEVGTLSLNDEIFAVPYNEALIHEVVVAHLANNRQGTQSALTRSEVRGHAKKPWRQKGTGHARHGSTKAPQWTGGGIAFAVKPRDYTKKVNKKAKAIAFLSAISTKIKDEELFVINEFNFAEPKTKLMQEVLKNFEAKGRTLIVTEANDETVLRVSNNLQNVSVVTSELLNTYELVSNEKVLITEKAIKQLEEAYEQ
jgi:large subunit ribosomal protein L4